MPKNRRNDRHAREAAARAKHAQHQPPGTPAPAQAVTEASVALAAALDAAQLPGLARRARNLEFDENHSESAFPLRDLVRALTAAGHPSLVQRVVDGEFDATEADNTAYYASPEGVAEAAHIEEVLAANPELEKAAEKFFAYLNEDPKRADLYAREGAAALTADLAVVGGGRDVFDDDAPIDPTQLHPAIRTMVGKRAPNGERLDTPEILACADLGARTGAVMFDIWHDDHFHAWRAEAAFNGGHIVHSNQQPTPSAAARTLAEKLLTGGQCQHCHGISTTDPTGAWAHDKTLTNGQRWTAQQQQDAGVCLWYRDGVHWHRGCEER